MIIDNNLSLRNRHKFVLGIFDDEDKLVAATRALVDSGVKVHDVYTPYPVHGLERIIKARRSNLSIVAFLCGLTGFLLAYTMIWYMYVYDWPINVGNKPERFTPSWIPVLFESTVLCTAFGMAFFFFWRNRLAHGIKPELLDIRQTDDRMIIAVESTNGLDESAVKSLMSNNGSIEIRDRVGGVQTTSSSSGSKPTAQTKAVSHEEPKSFSQAAEAQVEKESASMAELTEEQRIEKLNVLKSIIGEANPDAADDLKDIVGVGPKFEKDLHSLGIYTFEQITKLTPEGIEAVEALTRFPGRIERENWIGQCKEFLANRNN